MPVDLSKSVSNPYANQHYRESPWQFFLSNLGFRTQADAWRENMAVQAAEFDSALQQKAADMEYNDPVHQLERMRAAGLNPDIDGGSSISPGEAPALPQDPSTPMQATSDGDQIMPIVNGIMSAFSTAVGMVGSFQGIQKNALNNKILAYQGESDFSKFAESISGMFLPESPEPAGMMNGFDWKAQALRNAETYANQHLPKKMRQKFLDFQHQYWTSAAGEGLSYEDFKNRINSKRDYYFEKNTNWDEFDSVLQTIVEPLAKMNEKIYAQSQKTSLKQGEAAEVGAQTEKAYQQELSGSEMAEAQNQSNRSASAASENMAIIQETIRAITRGLESSSKKGGIEGAVSSIALALISGLYLYTQSGIHPSISRSEGSNSGYFETNRGHGANQGSKRSFSIGF